MYPYLRVWTVGWHSWTFGSDRSPQAHQKPQDTSPLDFLLDWKEQNKRQTGDDKGLQALREPVLLLKTGIISRGHIMLFEFSLSFSMLYTVAFCTCKISAKLQSPQQSAILSNRKHFFWIGSALSELQPFLLLFVYVTQHHLQLGDLLCIGWSSCPCCLPLLYKDVEGKFMSKATDISVVARPNTKVFISGVDEEFWRTFFLSRAISIYLFNYLLISQAKKTKHWQKKQNKRKTRTVIIKIIRTGLC